jgi:raffinose/stachyose/melibiose transport system substrate-binding protein
MNRSISSRRKLGAITTAAVLGVTLLAACGGGASVTGGGNGGTGTKNFTYWSMFSQDEPEAKVLKKEIAAFETESGVKVNVQWQGRDVLQKVTAALNTNDVPDLVDQADNALKGLLAKNGQALDLSAVYQMPIPGEAGKTIADVIPAKYDPFTKYNGKYFMVPVTAQGYAMWYDGAKLPAVTKNPPKTWDAFVSLLGQLKAKGDSPLALDASTSYYNEYWIATALVRTLGPDGLHKLVQDKTGNGWRDPRVAQAVDAMAALVQKHYFVAGYDSSQWPAVQKEWAQGNADFLYLGGWIPNETATYAKPGLDYRSFNFPQMASGGDYSVPVALNGFAIPSKAKNAPAAEKFIAYFYNKSRLGLLSSEAHNLTPRPDIAAPPQLVDLQKLLINQKFSSINDQVPADYPDFDTKVLQAMSTKLMTGQVTASQFISGMASQQAQYWKLNG